MIQSRNKKLSNNKHYNIQKGKKDNSFFFLFPTVIFSPKKFLHWDQIMFSIFLGWGKYYLQYNVFETVKNPSTDVLKPDMVALLTILKSDNLFLSQDINSMHNLLDFLNKNTYLVNLLKNANLNHTYIKNIFISYIQEQPFIIRK